MDGILKIKLNKSLKRVRKKIMKFIVGDWGGGGGPEKRKGGSGSESVSQLHTVATGFPLVL